MIRISKSLIPLLAATAWGCNDPDRTDGPAPAAGDRPIRWDVASVTSPGVQSRSLVGPAPEEGQTTDWITLEQACTPTAAGGNGKAIGIWADYTYQDLQGDEITIKNLFSGTRLIHAHKPNGNPYSDWNYEGEDLYWYIGGRYKFRAFFPQEISENVVSSASATTFVIEYPTHSLQEDLLLAYNAVDTTDPQVDLGKPVDLNFSHGLAAIRFIIKANFATEDKLTSCYFQNADTRDFATSGILAYGSETETESISWSLGYYPPVTEKIYYWQNTGIEFSTDEQGSATSATAYSAAGTTNGDLFTGNNGWVLILPQASSGSLKFCFTTQSGGDAVFTVTIPQVTERIDNGDGTFTESTEYLPGKRYTYTVSISKTDLELTLTVADWNERESSHSIIF